MIFKLTMMSKQEILIESQQDLLKLLNEANKGSRLVLTKHGVVNVASIDSIVPWTSKNQDVAEMLRLKHESAGKLVPMYTPDTAFKMIVGESPFKAMLDERKKELSFGEHNPAIPPKELPKP